MNIYEQIKNLSAKIDSADKRMEEIKVELRKADLSNEDFDKFQNEFSSLANERMSDITERESLISQMETMKREASKVAMDQKEDLGDMNKRDAYALMIGKAMRKKTFTDSEKRALDKSLGSTATTYVAPTASADGVSNFGVFINTKVLGDLLEEDRDESPILRDAILYRVKGLTTFPYRKQRTIANNKVEGKAVNPATWEFGTVEGKKGYLQSILQVTDEVLSLSDIDLGNYVISLMIEDMREDFASALLYGNGTTGVVGTTPAQVAGITLNANAITANKNTIFVDLVNAFTALPKRYKKGAQFYVSQEVYEYLALAKDGAGHYIYDVRTYPQITILGRPVEVEPNLATNAVLIGNVRKYYKGNLLKDVTIETQKDINSQIHNFVASAFACCAPVPTAFSYGVVTTTSTSSSSSN